MAKKPNISSVVQNATMVTTINNNFQNIQAAFENTISRDGSIPNSMSGDLDLNNNDLLNVGSILIGGVDYLTLAEGYKNDAYASAVAAAASEAAAAISAASAASSLASIGTSASDAAASATAAASSATAAATSASDAATSETNAATSASAAASSASSASTSATSADSSASAASSSASSAATSATNASNSATAAQTAQTAAEAAYDSFDDRYLGAKASAPTLDNDGDPLLTGALYYNTTDGQLYVWNGSAWDDAAFNASGAVTSFNTRTGAVTLNSTDVNTALGSDAVLDSDIGVTVQAYNANYVVDASYVHTDNNYTTTEKNKLAGIEAGADVTDPANVTTALGSISIEALSDVNTMTPTDGQVLTWDNGNSRWDAMSTLKVNSIQAANAGSEDYFLARAWVNFNGTGTVAVRNSGNVSSLTDNGTGLYTVNFSDALSSSDYAATRYPDYDSAAGSTSVQVSEVLSATTSSIQVSSENSGGTRYDCLRFDMVVTL